MTKLNERFIGDNVAKDNVLLSEVAHIVASSADYTVDWQADDAYVTVAFAEWFTVGSTLAEIAQMIDADFIVDDEKQVITFKDKAGVDN